MNSNVKSSIKEAVGYLEEEAGELLDDKAMAGKGRRLRNEGRMEQGKNPKMTEPGTTDEHNV